jgi:hypothetical protein
MSRRRDEWPNWETNPPGPRKVVKWVVIGVVLLFVLSGIAWVFSMTVGRGAAVVERVTDPDRLLTTYEGYYDKCTVVAAYDHNIADAKLRYDEAQKQAQVNDPLGLKAQDVQQARTEMQGLIQRRREIMAEYNSQSLQITRLNGLTKGDDLPARIEDGVTPKCGTNDPGF